MNGIASLLSGRVLFAETGNLLDAEDLVEGPRCRVAFGDRLHPTGYVPEAGAAASLTQLCKLQAELVLPP